jgi:hypothetical protein
MPDTLLTLDGELTINPDNYLGLSKKSFFENDKGQAITTYHFDDLEMDLPSYVGSLNENHLVTQLNFCNCEGVYGENFSKIILNKFPNLRAVSLMEVSEYGDQEKLISDLNRNIPKLKTLEVDGDNRLTRSALHKPTSETLAKGRPRT